MLATDESGDDGAFVEEARQVAVGRAVPIYVIGRQSMFGSSTVRLPYTDPVTKDVYWPKIRRGPETAGLENLQYDGLHNRWDEQPSGFGPYELARLTKDTGGIYFLLPSEETMRWTAAGEGVLDGHAQGVRARLREPRRLRRAGREVAAASRA